MAQPIQKPKGAGFWELAAGIIAPVFGAIVEGIIDTVTEHKDELVQLASGKLKLGLPVHAGKGEQAEHDDGNSAEVDV